MFVTVCNMWLCLQLSLNYHQTQWWPQRRQDNNNNNNNSDNNNDRDDDDTNNNNHTVWGLERWGQRDEGRGSRHRHSASSRYVFYHSYFQVTYTSNYLGHIHYHFSTNLLQREIWGQGLVMQTRCEPQVCFLSFHSYFTNDYLLLLI